MAGQFGQGVTGKAVSERFVRMKREPCWNLSIDTDTTGDGSTPAKVTPRKRGSRGTPKSAKAAAAMNGSGEDDDEGSEFGATPSKKKTVLNRVKNGRVTKPKGGKSASASFTDPDEDEEDMVKAENGGGEGYKFSFDQHENNYGGEDGGGKFPSLLCSVHDANDLQMMRLSSSIWKKLRHLTQPTMSTARFRSLDSTSVTTPQSLAFRFLISKTAFIDPASTYDSVAFTYSVSFDYFFLGVTLQHNTFLTTSHLGDSQQSTHQSPTQTSFESTTQDLGDEILRLDFMMRLVSRLWSDVLYLPRCGLVIPISSLLYSVSGFGTVFGIDLPLFISTPLISNTTSPRFPTSAIRSGIELPVPDSTSSLIPGSLDFPDLP